MEFVIVTGLSGAGRSQAANVLEDLGYFCMDNVPPQLLPQFATLHQASEFRVKKVAAVVDIRGGEYFQDLFDVLEQFEDQGHHCQILYLDCQDEVLVKRYKEHRRPHPMNPDGSIIEGIRKERETLRRIFELAQIVIDTSNLTLGKLRERIVEELNGGDGSELFKLNVLSFGFKHGIPLEADLVFDVRFLPNPFYVPELRTKTGNDAAVQDYVMDFEDAKVFLDKVLDMLDFLIPRYQKEGKQRLVVAIGCTGGKHRSVTLANRIYQAMEGGAGYQSNLIHRDERKAGK
jgi:UPF0042 nucleotide-binding protein